MTTVEFHSNIGSVWQRGLQLWDAFATGIYIDLSTAYNGSFDNKAWDITVTNPDSSTDVFTLISGELDVSGQGAMQYLAGNPGFHATLSKVYPNPLPDGGSPWARYRNMMWNWRLNIWSNVCGGTADLQNEDDTGTRYGVTTRFIFIAHFKNLNVVMDASGILWGTPTVDSWNGYPSDFVGASPIAIGGAGGGGSPVDLTPVVDAINDVALIDVTYTANNGATIFSLRGKTRT